MKMKKTKTICLCLTVCFVLNGITNAAIIYDLSDPTPPKDDSVVINGAIFDQFRTQPAGTGVFDPFVRIQVQGAGDGVERGYNTAGRPVQFDTKDENHWTEPLPVSSLLSEGGYYTFFLDIDEPGGSKAMISLDQLRVHIANADDLLGYDETDTWDSPVWGAFGAPIYDLDAGGDNWVKLDWTVFGGGSGKGDLRVRILDDLFTGGDFVYLYSKFGVNIVSADGFEEWNALIPEPVTLSLLGIGTLSLLRRRKK